MRMGMIHSGNASKALQIGFLVVLAASIAQVAWWIADQVNLAHGYRDQVAALFEADAKAVTTVLATLPDAIDSAPLDDQFSQLMPHLRIDAAQASVRPEAAPIWPRKCPRASTATLGRGASFCLCCSAAWPCSPAPSATMRNCAAVSRTFLLRSRTSSRALWRACALPPRRSHCAPRTPTAGAWGQRLLEDGDRLLGMVDNLLDTARIEEGRLEVRREAVPLAALVAAACARIADEAAGRGVHIDSTVAEDIGLDGDAEVIETVLRNLLDKRSEGVRRRQRQHHPRVRRTPRQGCHGYRRRRRHRLSAQGCGAHIRQVLSRWPTTHAGHRLGSVHRRPAHGALRRSVTAHSCGRAKAPA